MEDNEGKNNYNVHITQLALLTFPIVAVLCKKRQTHFPFAHTVIHLASFIELYSLKCNKVIHFYIFCTMQYEFLCASDSSYSETSIYDFFGIQWI